ncbi:hypothetical protein CCH79_00000042 [Gambusia affinis]|uniref:Protein kinase C-terminal domain-containing protein n=1 Tax=Gambusia affinis TaxID=33528 RepID=A0A315VW38_GAMAF|nr:hypothetical protein CCH79_00000042 [Gambusia affinis]
MRLDGEREEGRGGSSFSLQSLSLINPPVTLGSTETSGVPVSAMKMVNGGGGGGGGGGGRGEKTTFSFKKCSAFQFVKRKVRRWMRNPKVNVEKAQGKNLLYPCPRCPLTEDLWYTHLPSPYGCCHYAGLQGCHYYHQELCSPCTKAGQPSGHEKGKSCKSICPQQKLPAQMSWQMISGSCPFMISMSMSQVFTCLTLRRDKAVGVARYQPPLFSIGSHKTSQVTGQVRKWRMLSRHHNENVGKPKEAESDVHMDGCQCWALHTSPLLASPVILECTICSGPYISYAMEDSWQPRQRTQAMDLDYHNDSEQDSYCCPGDSSNAERILTLIMTIKTETEKPALTYSKTRGLVELVAAFMKQRRMGLNDLIQKLSTNSYACKHSEVQSILNLTPPQDPELMNSNPSPPTGPNDLRHFDPEFTDEPVPSSIGCSPDCVLATASIKEAAEAFEGFSYAPSMDSYL